MPEQQFSYTMSFVRATAAEADKKPHVVMRASDTRLDWYGDHMEKKALDSMAAFLKGGNVLLLPDHNGSFEIGTSTNGWVQKSKDGDAWELYAEFEVDPDDRFAMKLHKEVEAGTCKRQASVGGTAEVRPYYNAELKKTVRALEDVTDLEHIAVTRANRAAVPSTKFTSAIFKSMPISDSEKQLATFEKAALKDSERKKSATVVKDNGTNHSFYMEGDKLYLHPIPDGDRNAAKVALSESSYSPFLSEKERQTVHDRAAEVLGSEHNEDGYCYRCSKASKDFAYSQPDNALNATTQIKKEAGQPPAGDPSDMTPEEKAVYDAALATLTKNQTDTQTALTGITALLKGIGGIVNDTQTDPAKKLDIAKALGEAPAAPGPMTEETLAAAFAKGLATAFPNLGVPLERTKEGVAAGAEAAAKPAVDVAKAVEAAAGGGDKTEVQKGIEASTADAEKHKATLAELANIKKYRALTSDELMKASTANIEMNKSIDMAKYLSVVGKA